jgi:hypothetical protein
MVINLEWKGEELLGAWCLVAWCRCGAVMPSTDLQLPIVAC